MEEFLLVTFNNTNEAFLAEKGISEETSTTRLIPVPTEISSGCGLALKIPLENAEELEHYIKEKFYNKNNIFLVKKNLFTKTITEFSYGNEDNNG